MPSKPNKDHLETLHDYDIHIPSRTIFLGSSVDDEGGEDGVNYFMVQRFLKNLHLLEITNKKPITIILNTEGGDESQGMAIFDAIKNSKCYVTIKVKGNAQSMGSIILQSGDERIISEHSQLMFHLGTSNTGGGNVYEVYNTAKFEIEYGEKIDKILFERIQEKFHKEKKAFTKNKFKEMNFKGRYLHAQEAIDFGLADKIE